MNYVFFFVLVLKAGSSENDYRIFASKTITLKYFYKKIPVSSSLLIRLGIKVSRVWYRWDMGMYPSLKGVKL